MKKKILYAFSSILLLSSSLTSCGDKSVVNGVKLSNTKPTYQVEDHTNNYIDDTYKNYYQILVYSYFDSNNDGIGDLNGLTQKLDYINDGIRFVRRTIMAIDPLQLVESPITGTLTPGQNTITPVNSKKMSAILEVRVDGVNLKKDTPWLIDNDIVNIG